MRVIAKGNRGSHLSESALALSGNTVNSVFQLTIGLQYPVYAMALWPSGIAVMVLGDHRMSIGVIWICSTFWTDASWVIGGLVSDRKVGRCTHCGDMRRWLPILRITIG